jgi:hypothetical protein
MARSSAPLILLAGVTVVLGALRLYAATRVGFGDSEALYACYALHPQPAYLDHPGLVGLLARMFTEGARLTPARAHAFTAVIATAAPWLAVPVARAFGATRERALAPALVFAVAPETAVGLFGMTPDLLLFPLWLGSLGLAATGLRAEPSSTRAAATLLGAGLLAGIACTAKVSGVTLLVALAATYASRAVRGAHGRTPWPWAGLAAGLLANEPVLAWEARHGWPMLRHRLVDTQATAGLSLQNLGQVIGGQLIYVSPVLLVTAFITAREVLRSRARAVPRSPTGEGPSRTRTLLFYAFVVPLAVLLPLSLWSRIAEPHWLAPALVPLPFHAASADPSPVRERLARRAVGTALALSLAAHTWVLVPAAARLVPQSRERLDIAQELYGWPDAIAAVRETIAGRDDEDEVVLVGPHWVICAQLHAALDPSLPVGCLTPIRDDFEDWFPRSSWRNARTLVYVTDARFDLDLSTTFPRHAAEESRRIAVTRASRVVREFRIIVLHRSASAAL